MNPPPDPTQFWTWTTLIALAATTGLITAVFNSLFGVFKDWLTNRRQDVRDGRVAAYQLVSLLTQYAQRCNSLIEASEYERATGSIGYEQKIPILPPYPEGISWPSLPRSVAAGIFDLRSEVDVAKEHLKVSYAVDFDPKEYTETAEMHLAFVGYAAHRLAARLRRRYGFGLYQAAGYYTYLPRLKARYDKEHQSIFRRTLKGTQAYRKVKSLGLSIKGRFLRLLVDKP